MTGVKAVLAILFAIVLTVVGFGIIAMNVHSLTMPLLIFAGACFVLALGLAIPANLKAALIIVTPLLPDSIFGGRRKTDPQPPDPPAP